MIAKKIFTAVSLMFMLMLSVVTTAQQAEESIRAVGGHFFDPIPVRTNPDLELLTGFNLEKKLGNKLKLGLNYQTRFNDFMTSFQANLAEASVGYKVNKNISLKSGYRLGLIASKDWHGYVSTGVQQRLMIAGYFKWKLKSIPLKFQIRTRMEQMWNDEFVDRFTYFRPRISLKFAPVKMAELYASAEPFINTDQLVPILNRYETGVNWKLKKDTRLSTFYRLETLFNRNESYIHMVGVVWDVRY